MATHLLWGDSFGKHATIEAFWFTFGKYSEWKMATFV